MSKLKWTKLTLQKIVFVLIAILGVTYIYYTWRSTEKDKFDHARLIARLVVATLPIEDLKALEAKPGDIDKPQYQVIKNALKEVISVNTTARFTYIFTKRNDKIYYIADSESGGSKYYSPPGQEHTEDKLVVGQPFKDGKEQIKVSITDKWGIWTSVLIPIKDKVTGKTIAVFGMNFNAKLWYNSIFIEVIKSIVLILLLLVAVVLLYIIKITNKILKDDIAKLHQAEVELKQQKEEFEMIFNLVPVQIWYKDIHNNFIRVNRLACSYVGLPENEIKGHSAEEIFPSFAHKYFEDDLEVFNSCKSKLEIIEQVNIDSGELKWVHTDKFPVFGNTGELLGLVAFVQDITYRKMTEDALRNSEAQLHTLVQTIPDLIWLKNKEGVYLNCNIMFERFFGARETDIIGKTDYDFVEKDLAEFFRDHDRKAMAAGKPTINEEWITFADDGHRAYLHTIKTPMYKADGKLIGILGIGRDITERKQAEIELLEREIQYRNLANSGIALIWTSDTDKLCNYFNEPWLKFTGRTLEQELGNGWAEGVHPNDLGTCLKTFITAFDNREAFNMEYRLRHADGDYRWIMDLGTANYNNGGEFIGYIGNCFDITERKLAEETLLKLSNAVEQTIDTIVITDCDGTIEYVNHAFEVLTGYSSKEALGKTLGILKSGTKDQKYYEVLWKTILSGKVFRSEMLNKKKNGDLYYVEKTISPIFDKNKTITHFVGTGIDITDRKQAEKELIEAKNKAEESDRLKSAFLANMSHEIRTPMNGILGFAGLLKEPKLSGAEQQEYIGIIEQSGARMLNIINDIVSISKVESGQMEVSIKETNINEQIEYIYTFFKPEAKKKGIQLHFNNSLPSKKSIIKTDREKIHAILTNLVKNALKFTHVGTIEFGYNLKSNSEPVELEFYVKDTGVGINPEHQKFIFERFRQGNEALNRNYEGSGLGLSISKAYVEMLGGKIWVESEEDKGSIFYFTIPYYVEPEERSVIKNVVLADTAENQIKDLKILIAEDDKGSKKLLTVLVKMFGKEVLEARTGVEAVEACRNNPDIDLVLMDMKMPDMDGHEATRQIRKFNTDVVIIAQTAYALSGDREKALAAGCNDYIAKPINKDILMALMKKYFKNRIMSTKPGSKNSHGVASIITHSDGTSIIRS